MRNSVGKTIKKLSINNRINFYNPFNLAISNKAAFDRFASSVSQMFFRRSSPIFIELDGGLSLKEVEAALRFAHGNLLAEPRNHPVDLVIKHKAPVHWEVSGRGDRMVISREFCRNMLGDTTERGIYDMQGLAPKTQKMMRSLKQIEFDYMSRLPSIKCLNHWADQSPSLTKFMNDHEHAFKERVVKHTLNVIATYNQIPGMFVSARLDSRPKPLGLERLFFQSEQSAKRAVANLDNLKEIFQRVPQYLIYLTILCHDFGKSRDETFHHEESFKILNEESMLHRFGLSAADQIMVKYAALYHVVPGGITLGEYSLMQCAKWFKERDILYLIKNNKFDLFVDNLILLTICDAAGYNAILPLNQRISNYLDLSSNLKNIGKLIKDNGKRAGSNGLEPSVIVGQLLPYIQENSNLRLSRILSANDRNLDKNTAQAEESYDFYVKKINQSMRSMKISRYKRARLERFISLFRSIVYGARFMTDIFWENAKDGREVVKKSYLNRGAILFLLALTKRIPLASRLPIDIILVREKDHRPLKRHEYHPYAAYFKKMLESRNFPEVDIMESRENVEVRIRLPDPPDARKKSEIAGDIIRYMRRHKE